MTLLLRAGARLDSCFGEKSAEDVIRGIEQSERDLALVGAQQFHPPWNADNETLKTIKELVAGVRREGSWLAFCWAWGWLF